MSRRADERMGGRESSEDYLEAILVIRRLRGSCRNVDIAETASAEACRMEHCLSEDSYRRFAAYLGSRRDEGDGG